MPRRHAARRGRRRACAAGDWRDRVPGRARRTARRFEGLFATARDAGRVELRAVFSSPAETRVIVCEPPAARRRDASSTRSRRPPGTSAKPHDLHGLRFVGHEPLRPLLDHDAPLAAWTVPTIGRDTHEVAVGPIHAGVIESGHFRFHVVGERILHLDVRLFYKRRGLEAAAAGRPLATALAYAQRACAACAVTNTRRLRAGLRSRRSASHPDRELAALAHAAARARTRLQPPPRHLRDLRRRRLRRRQRWPTRRSRNARSASTSASPATASCSTRCASAPAT